MLKKNTHTHTHAHVCASVILLNERWNITRGSVFTLWHLYNFLPRIWGGTWSFSLLFSGSHQAGCGEGQAAAGVAQLPSFSKEIRTFGWQGSCFHICSFRILCSCLTHCDLAYPFPCPKSCPGGLAEAGAGRGGVMGASPLPSGRLCHQQDAGLFICPCLALDLGQAAAV